MYFMPTYMVAIWSTQQLCPLEQEFSASDAPATTPLTFQQLQPVVQKAIAPLWLGFPGEWWALAQLTVRWTLDELSWLSPWNVTQ